MNGLKALGVGLAMAGASALAWAGGVTTGGSTTICTSYTTTTVDASGNIDISGCVAPVGGGTPTVSFTTATYSITEGGAVASVTVALSASTTSPVTVTVTTGGAAVADTDYAISTGANLTGGAGSYTLTIPAGATSGTIPVSPRVNDAVQQAQTSMTLTLSSPNNATLGGTTSKTVSILDDDTPTVTLSLSPASLTEGAATTVTLTSSIAAPAGGLVGTVNLTGATARLTDASPLAITIAAGQTTGTASLSTTDDAITNGTQAVTLTLASVTNGGQVGSPATGSLTVTDNDASACTPAGAVVDWAAANSPGSNTFGTIASTSTAGVAFRFRLNSATFPSGAFVKINVGTGTGAYNSRDIALSTCAGDHSVVANCLRTGVMTGSLAFGTGAASACPMQADTDYYFNIKATTAGQPVAFVITTQKY